MSKLTNIVAGHVSEFLGQNEEISKARLTICRKCGLYNYGIVGVTCNSSLYINPETDEVSEVYKDGYVKGCGCRLNAKTRVMYEACPANKW